MARSLRARWSRWNHKWRPADGLVTDDSAALEALREQQLGARAWSPSALEHFAMCPYKFALHGIYRLKPRDESEQLQQMDPRTRGALFHEIQFELFQDLQRAGLLPVNEDRLPEALTRADAMLDRVAAKYQEKLAPAIPRVWKSEIEDLRTDLRGWLQHVARNDDDWEPVQFELAFGDPPLALAEGVNLRGRIDLGRETRLARSVSRDRSQDRQASRHDPALGGRRPELAAASVWARRRAIIGIAGRSGTAAICDPARRLHARRDQARRTRPAVPAETPGRYRRIDCRRLPASRRPPKTPARSATTGSCAGRMKNAGSARKTGTMFGWSR